MNLEIILKYFSENFLYIFFFFFQLQEEDRKSLPKWLVFDKQKFVLEGVPTENDIGDYRISIRAYDPKGRFASDVFTVEVFPLLEKNTDNKVRICGSKETKKKNVYIR